MMSTLLLRLAGPLQSWGTDSKFDIRKTDRYPSKSGVVGLLAAALGLPRDADLGRFNGMRFGVRIDNEGKLIRDFHMAHKDAKTSYLTNRYYLSDAVFLAGFESDDEAFLNELDLALKNPAYPLFLGRRACPPVLPLALGVRKAALYDALRCEPCQLSDHMLMKRHDKNNRYIEDSDETPPLSGSTVDGGSDKREKREESAVPSLPQLRVIMDAAPQISGGSGFPDEAEDIFALLKDEPISFSQRQRKFTVRPVKEKYFAPDASWVYQHGTYHDAMSATDAFRDESDGAEAIGVLVSKGGNEMFLSRMRLNLSLRKTMLALASPNLFHGAVGGAFSMTSAAGAKQSGDESGRSGRKLWRIDYINGKCYLLLLSETKPDLTNAVKQFGFPDEKSETKDYTPLLKHVTNSSKWRFRLTANPTISKSTRGQAASGDKAQRGTPGTPQSGTPGNPRRGTLHAHITAEYQKKWLADRAEKHGFKLEADDFETVSSKWKKFRKGGANGSDVTLLSVTYEGLLTVTDAELFREALIGGIGRGKAYGLGLLTIIPSA